MIYLSRTDRHTLDFSFGGQLWTNAGDQTGLDLVDKKLNIQKSAVVAEIVKELLLNL